MSYIRFLQFNRLPAELRHEIWDLFALPRGPVLHTISRTLLNGRRIALFSEVEEGLLMELDRLPTTRALMQVNQEARIAVLSGRQLQNPFDSSSFAILARHGDTFHQKFFFVNWDIDMFFFRNGAQHIIHSVFEKSALSKIKHIAIEIDGPKQDGNVLRAPGYYNLVDKNTFCDPMFFARSHLPSTETIYLVLHYVPTVHTMTTFMMFPMENCEGDVDDYSNRTHFETMSRLSVFMGELNSKEENSDFGMRLPEDKFGLQHFEIESPTYTWKPIYYLSGRECPQNRVKALFRDWVDEMVSRAIEDVKEELGHPVEVQIVSKRIY
ncbi:hypothetical protein GGR55DRAFT_701872 [Xylaria sp. FL0064]|nr:hypothetical protein GGR55DRAFT_701872 [Xylaria sp. FL0064]